MILIFAGLDAIARNLPAALRRERLTNERPVTEEARLFTQDVFSTVQRIFVSSRRTIEAGIVALRWPSKYGRSWILIVFVAAGVAGFFAFWIPTSEAKRYRNDLRSAASLSFGTQQNPKDIPEAEPRPSTRSQLPILSGLGYLVDPEAPRGLRDLQSAFGLGALTIRNWLEDPDDGTAFSALVHRPKLVTVAFRSEKGTLRPMLSVAEYGGALVLYDFLLDDEWDDDIIYPIRTIAQSDIRSTTAIDPSGRTPADVLEGLGKQKGALPIVAILVAACGLDPMANLEANDSDSEARKAAKKRIKDECSGTDFKTCIRKQFVQEDVIACRARDLERPEELVERDQAPQAIYISWPPNPTGSDFTQRLTEVGERLADLIEAQPVPPPPPPVFLFQEISVAGQAPGRSGRWQGCSQLTSWRKTVAGLEFAKGSALLEGPLRHGLVLDGKATDDKEAAWAEFERILDGWLAEVAAERGKRPDSQKVLFLIGQASVDGRNSFNLALTERRAHAVREFLVRRREALIDSGLITDPGARSERIWIIPFGEGESIQAPDELIDSNSMRRVDAYLCHGAMPVVGARIDIQ